MTANGPSPHRNPVEEPPPRRPDDNARLHPITRPTPSAAPRSSALQRPHRNLGRPGEPRVPLDTVVHIRPAHRCRPTARSDNVKSP